MTTPYLMWHDDSPKRTTDQKIVDGVLRYTERFHGAMPNTVLINPIHAGCAAPAGVEVVIKADIRPNTFWIGRQG